MTEQFEKDVISGLSSTPKRLPSRYFYDEKGDGIFQQIMDLEDYYLTNSEYEVLDQNGHAIFESIPQGNFNLLEFGAGDGLKTRVLLRHLLSEGADFTYRPIDISANAIDGLTAALADELPELQVRGIVKEYFQALKELENGAKRSVVLFLGSNIGNFSDAQAARFLDELYASLHPGDMVLIGFDLKKDPRKILRAYDDESGVTAAFNLNLLDRINRELGADFEIDNFMHYPTYDPVSGEARSYLISTTDQTVHLGNHSIHFNAWEPIHTEISRKYHPEDTDGLAEGSGFTVVRHFYDASRNFMDVLWKK